MRELVTVQTIGAIEPIPNADFIEVARVLGWKVIVRKGSFSVGDHAAFFEVDSLLPEGDPRYDEFQGNGQRTMVQDGTEVRGHVLSTKKLRGVISQGLILGLGTLGLDQSLPVGTDITGDAGVLKWEETVPLSNDIIGSFDSRFAPKTDSIRAQTLAEHWDEIVALGWEPTIKVDGTSQTLVNDGGNIRIFGRNWEQSPEVSGMTIAQKFGLVDAIRDHLGMAIQFELAGPGISRNRLKLDALRPFIFSVWEDRKKVARQNWDPRLIPLSVPVLADEWKPQGTLEDMIAKVETLRGNITKDLLDEGVVFHPTQEGEHPDWLGSNANFKVINNKYLVKHGL